jgi:ankyrin repeat protein
MSFASLDTIRMLFDHYNGDVHRGQLLHHAVFRDGPESEVVELLQLLLDKGASINQIQYKNHPRSWAQKEPFGMGTPLHYAVDLNRLHVVSFLLENGADPTIADSKGKTASDICKLQEDGDAVLQLLQRYETHFR